MSSYLICLRRKVLNIDRDVAFVKEGFSFPAFFLNIFWAAWFRLWLAAAIYIFLQIILLLFIYFLEPDALSQSVLFISFAIIFGYVANDIRQQKLFQEGFELYGIMQGKNKGQVYEKFFSNLPDDFI